ncbi:hypothetical protein [Sphaerochaeta globosa]|uniref:Uncharacterized protein n=1 Tax=Sphaerochaeta globosa (strain ATCC BAA-1886 / DSM 22777 / Buddy) TaxID=158189 RepID=F0RTI0_SPHGB|nr:hypothetical protein [Sphaerochaeta globosa]ADY14175.1 hypothetical protein SpiBuddy_2360 [Sphaerochaeta globosa str. Buddy]
MYEVKSVKSFMGTEGYGYNCNLYRDGKKVAEVVDTADGGAVNFYWEAKGEAEDFHQYALNLPMIDMSKFGLADVPQDIDTAIGGLVDEYENTKRLKALCSKNWVYKFENHKSDEIACFKKNHPDIRKVIETKYENQIVECINDRFQKEN